MADSLLSLLGSMHFAPLLQLLLPPLLPDLWAAEMAELAGRVILATLGVHESARLAAARCMTDGAHAGEPKRAEGSSSKRVADVGLLLHHGRLIPRRTRQDASMFLWAATSKAGTSLLGGADANDLLLQNLSQAQHRATPIPYLLAGQLQD